MIEKVKERGRANVQNCEPIPVRQQGWFGYYGPGIYEGFDPAPNLPEKIGGRGLGNQGRERYYKYVGAAAAVGTIGIIIYLLRLLLA